MVCDVIAEPQRVPQLLEAWCEGEWAQAEILKS
jgi:23S rRNA C2498 (ribose-2'-O)-methylase RlmM